MAAVALEPELLAGDPDVPARLGNLARDAGLLARGIRDGVALAPALVVTDEHLELAVGPSGQRSTPSVRVHR